MSMTIFEGVQDLAVILCTWEQHDDGYSSELLADIWQKCIVSKISSVNLVSDLLL